MSTNTSTRPPITGEPPVTPEVTPEEDPAREAVIRDPGLVDRPADGPGPEDQPTDPEAPGRGVEETEEPIPEPNEPA